MSGRREVWARVPAALCVSLVGCSLVTGYPDTAAETGNDLCHDGTDNDLDGAPDCVDVDCRDFCPRADDVNRPDFTPCFAADGYRFVAVSERDDRLVCAPFPPNPDVCEEGELLLPGTTECRALTGPGCDGIELPAETIHVSPDASGGDGTAEDPFGTIDSALLAAGPGDTVALAAGRYEEAVVVDKPLTLTGSCAARTRIVADGGGPAVRIAADGITVERLALEAGGAGLVVDGASDVRVRGLHVESASGEGLGVVGGALEAEEVVVDATAGRDSAGVRVRDGGVLHMKGGLVRGGEGAGVEVVEAEVTLRAVGVADAGGVGVMVGQSAHATLEGVVVQRSGGSLVSVDCRNASAECLNVTGSVLEGRRGGGIGVEVRSGRVSLAQTRLSGATGRGVLVDQSVVDLTDVVVEGTDATEESTGIGVEVAGGGALNGERIELRANTNRGLLVHGPGSRAQPRDVSVLADLELTSRGVGIEVREPSSLVLMGFQVREAGRCGVAVRGEVTLSLSSGVILGGSTGVCISDADVGLGQLTSSVTYRVDDPIMVE